MIHFKITRTLIVYTLWSRITWTPTCLPFCASKSSAKRNDSFSHEVIAKLKSANYILYSSGKHGGNWFIIVPPNYFFPSWSIREQFVGIIIISPRINLKPTCLPFCASKEKLMRSTNWGRSTKVNELSLPVSF